MARLALSKAGLHKAASADVDPLSNSDLVAAMAVLVADDTTPTQAHVTDADAALTAATPSQSAILVSFDAAVFPTVSSLRLAFNELLAAAAATGMTL